MNAIKLALLHSKPLTKCRIRKSFAWFVQPKGGLISESFSRCHKSPKKVPNHSPAHLLFRRIVLRIVILPIFWEISVKVKKFWDQATFSLSRPGLCTQSIRLMHFSNSLSMPMTIFLGFFPNLLYILIDTFFQFWNLR